MADAIPGKKSATAEITGVRPKSLLPPEEVIAAPEAVLTKKEQIVTSVKEKLAKVSAQSPLRDTAIKVDAVNERLELGRVDRGLKRLTWLSWLIALFACILALGAPFFAPLYEFHSITPDGRIATLVPLSLPNLTNPAIVSWAATSVTEIQSLGFGDIEAKTLLQKKRFTTTAWDAFVKAYQNNQILETFRKSQMVMTTVPRDTPVILSQGVNEDGIYEWKVDVPVITTYAGNNNVTKPELATIHMTIVRVPYDQSTSGIAIDIWKQIKH